jgi:nucleoid-associated protein YgaU
VTRELKLALIVGFLLVLLVSVLIADHLSTARKAQLDEKVATQPVVVPITQPQAVPSQPIVITQGRTGSIVEPGTTQTASTTPGQDPTVVGQVVGRVGERISDVANGNTQIPPAVNTTQVTVGNSTPPLIPFGQSPISQQPVAANQTSADTLGANGASSPTITLSTTPELPTIAGPSVTTLELPTLVPEPAPLNQPSAADTEDRWHTIAAGDSAYSIAKKYYGKGEYWKQLAKYNGDRMGKNGVLRVGVRVKIPTADKLGIASSALIGKNLPVAPVKADAAKPVDKDSKIAKSSGARSYVVKKGDTLGHIAQRELGTTKRADEIMKLNKISDAASLRVGQTLAMPTK